MSFPQIASVQKDSDISGANPCVVALPASIAAGDLIIVIHSLGGIGNRTAYSSGWVEIYDHANAAGDHSTGVAYLIASGGETSVNITVSAAERWTSLAIRIAAANWHGTTPPEISTVAEDSTGTDANPDPDSISPSWGSDDNLFIAFCTWADRFAARTVSAYPTNYADNQTEGDAQTSGGRCAMASRGLAAASDNPAAFTLSAGDEWNAGTIVVRPAAAGGISIPVMEQQPQIPERHVEVVGYKTRLQQRWKRRRGVMVPAWV